MLEGWAKVIYVNRQKKTKNKQNEIRRRCSLFIMLLSIWRGFARNKIDSVPHFFIHTNISTIQPVYKKRSNYHEKIVRRLCYLP
jgi:hypothetical protein